jgi:large subunit ribosomal protein L18
MATKKNLRRIKIKRGIRKKIAGTSNAPRLSVFKSNSSIYAQLIDDTLGKTIVAASSKELSDGRSVNTSVSSQVGKKLAEKATAAGITTAVFDRNGYLYHGKVKALADGAREGGLQF